MVYKKFKAGDKVIFINKNVVKTAPQIATFVQYNDGDAPFDCTIILDDGSVKGRMGAYYEELCPCGKMGKILYL